MKKLLLFLFVPSTFMYAQTLPRPQFMNATSSHLPQKDLSSNSMDIASPDLDGDGDPDLVIASEFRQNLIYFNDGKGKFTDKTMQVLPPKKNDSEDIAAADLDGDGDIDLVFVSEDTYEHEMYLNDGKGNFMEASERIPVKSKANAVLEGDFDKDGDIDLILGNDGQDIFLANDGKGNFKDETTTHLPSDQSVTQDIESADLDGDKDMDLVLGNEDGNKIYLNNGSGKFEDATPALLPPASGDEETRKVDIADVDGDGDQDLFFSNVNFTKNKNIANRLLINNGKGKFTDETGLRFKGINDYHTADAGFADMDGDKDPDLVVANIFQGKMQYFENDGKGVFIEKSGAIFPINPSADAIAIEVRDLNMDGLSDLFIGAFRSNNVLLFQKK